MYNRACPPTSLCYSPHNLCQSHTDKILFFFFKPTTSVSTPLQQRKWITGDLDNQKTVGLITKSMLQSFLTWKIKLFFYYYTEQTYNISNFNEYQSSWSQVTSIQTYSYNWPLKGSCTDVPPPVKMTLTSLLYSDGEASGPHLSPCRIETTLTSPKKCTRPISSNTCWSNSAASPPRASSPTTVLSCTQEGRRNLQRAVRWGRAGDWNPPPLGHLRGLTHLADSHNNVQWPLSPRPLPFLPFLSKRLHRSLSKSFYPQTVKCAPSTTPNESLMTHSPPLTTGFNPQAAKLV